jgi:hypothetical protein
MQLNWGPLITHMPVCSQSADRIDEHVPKEDLQTLYGYSDADWDMDILHRRSISGIFSSLLVLLLQVKLAYNPPLHSAQLIQNSLQQATLVTLVFSSTQSVTNYTNINVPQRAFIRIMTFAEWLQTQERPLAICVI